MVSLFPEQFLEHGIPRLNECINLFRHDSTKPNILQLINAASEITEDALVEIVLSGSEPVQASHVEFAFIFL